MSFFGQPDVKNAKIARKVRNRGKRVVKIILNLAMVLVVISGCRGQESSDSASGESVSFEEPVSTFLGDYDEVYSGYWSLNSAYCSATGLLRLVIKDDVAEISTDSGSLSDVTGTVDMEGNLFFDDRTPSLDCNRCTPPPILSTSGWIDFDSETGHVRYEVACRVAPSGYIVTSISVELSEGYFQPSPRSEVIRIDNELQELIDSENFCTQSSECSILKMIPNDVCNLDNPAYSTATVDQELLQILLDEYRYFRRLTGFDAGTSTTLCSGNFVATCDIGVCEKVWR